MPTRYMEPPMRRIQYIGRIAMSVSTKVGYMSDPSGFVARHIMPCVTPLIHIDTM